jgi:hypothetical protein
MISLAIDEQKKSSMKGVQARFLTLKLEPFPKFERDATMTRLQNWDHLATTHYNPTHNSHLHDHVLSY